MGMKVFALRTISIVFAACACCSAEEEACLNVNSTNHPLCYNAVVWAMREGIFTQPTYYEHYKGLNKHSSFGQFQCVLHNMNGNTTGDGHDCPMPCNVDFPPFCIAPSETDQTPATAATTTTPVPEESE